MKVNSKKLKIIFIGGSGRSGSTLLDCILGQIEGFFSLGEISHIWKGGFIENQLCGCGKSFVKGCEFWNAVVQKAFGSFDKIDAYRVLRLQRSVARTRHIPYLAFPKLRSQEFDLTLKEYIGILDYLYKAIGIVSGCSILIDSSKDPSHGFVLSEMPNIELYVIHLIRDSRAVVYSWQRKKRRLEIHWKEAYMPKYGPIKAAQKWMVSNLLIHWLKDKVKCYKVIKYENLAKEPQSTLKNILKWIRVDSVLSFFENKTTVRLNVNHTISGNPIRFKQGKVEVKLDEEWRKSLCWSHKFITTFLTAPLLRKYNYTF